VTTRTAGFCTADFAAMSEPGLLLTICLMLTGGSPGSTAGGMKTTTLAVLVISALSVFRRQNDGTAFGRRISTETVRSAAAILAVYLGLFITASAVICGVEKLPLLTSCCPAWVQYVEKRNPDFLPNVSTCRSPMSMFASVIKEYYRDHLPEGKTKHVHIAIMPCTAKKFEASRPEFRSHDQQDTDVVITTQELIKMIKESGIVFEEVEPEAVDMPFGTYSGAGVIFGVSGGVTEAVLRKIATSDNRKGIASLAYTGVRGLDGVKECVIPYGDREVHIAICSGLRNASDLLEAVRRGEKQFDLIEVMACYGGCISGAGQPYISRRRRINRGNGLYRADSTTPIRRSQDNPMMKELYEGILKGREHELLHVNYLKK
jgi:NADH-quinone oxidoreductase subunit G